jgi:hypothetical protein
VTWLDHETTEPKISAEVQANGVLGIISKEKLWQVEAVSQRGSGGFCCKKNLVDWK